MTSKEILKADMLDILFEFRNKNYGAYQLRKYYNQRLGTALAISVSGIFLLALLIKPELRKAVGNMFTNVDSVIISPPLEIPPEETVLPQERTTSNLAQENYTNRIQLVDDDVETDMATQDDFADAVISNQNTDGDKPLSAEQTVPASPGNSTEQQAAETKPFIPEEVQPEFPGGQEAWLNFLRKHLNTPADMEPGEKKTVYVRFLVDVDGSITKLEIVQSAGKAFDNEVVRVLKKMPHWKPARQNGHPIATAFTQPVTFIGVEE